MIYIARESTKVKRDVLEIKRQPCASCCAWKYEHVPGPSASSSLQSLPVKDGVKNFLSQQLHQALARWGVKETPPLDDDDTQLCEEEGLPAEVAEEIVSLCEAERLFDWKDHMNAM